MNTTLRRGFTLIELLTVIAIISILAALTFTVGPRMIERAKMNRLNSAMRQVSTALTTYYIDHQTYPPAYGYVSFDHANDENGPSDPALDPGFYNLMPYMARINYHGNNELYDEFSTSYDTANDTSLSPLEFSPVGFRKPDGTYELDPYLPRYIGQPNPMLSEEINRQLTGAPRPFIYIPVNKQQFARVQRYWLESGDAYAETWDTSNEAISRLKFPPRSYDAFVLISVGPAGNTFGLLPEPRNTVEMANNGRDMYHILGLRAYYLATRDLNGNNFLDFDYRARTQQGEGRHEYTVNYPGSGFTGTVNNNLPSPTMPAGAGPVIYASQ